MMFLALVVGWILVFSELFLFPALFHYTLFIDMSMIWILFSLDIFQEDAIYIFMTTLFLKTLFMSQPIVLPYIFLFALLFFLYYIFMPLFSKRETWLSFFLIQIWFAVYLFWIYRATGKSVTFSLLLEMLLFIGLLGLRKTFQRCRIANMRRIISFT